MSLLNNCRRRLPHMWLILAVLAVALTSANAATAFDTPTAAIWKADSGVNSAGIAATAAGKELKHTRNCKALCAHCGCLGFYCGEECICECNGGGGKDSTDTECIATMQSNARKLEIPFELLIQGPSANRFVRNARQFEQNVAVDADSADAGNAARNRRSTVVIYKPPRQNSLDAAQCAMKPPALKKLLEDDISARHKRSIGERFEWFNDFANTLVRPAPLGIRKAIAAPEEGSVQRKRSTNDVDRSWFADTSNLLLRPAPLFKRQRGGKSQAISAENASDGMSQMPQVDELVETLRNLQQNALSEDFAAQLRERLQDGANVFKERVQKGELMPEDMRDRLGETLSQLRERLFRNEVNENIPMKKPTPTTVAPPPPPPPTPESEPKRQFLLPWFRPVRFLQRVRQAIN